MFPRRYAETFPTRNRLFLRAIRTLPRESPATNCHKNRHKRENLGTSQNDKSLRILDLGFIGLRINGEGGIRTPAAVTRRPHFECGAFSRSATSPAPIDSTRNRPPNGQNRGSIRHIHFFRHLRIYRPRRAKPFISRSPKQVQITRGCMRTSPTSPPKPYSMVRKHDRMAISLSKAQPTRLSDRTISSRPTRSTPARRGCGRLRSAARMKSCPSCQPARR